MLLLIPHDPLAPRRADDHFAAEARAARAAGLDVRLVDHDGLIRGPAGASVLGRGDFDSDDVVYRGWMLRSEQYAALAAAVGARGGALRTTPQSYRRAHELPGWAATLAEWMPETVWTSSVDLDEFEGCCRLLGSGPAVLRDYVKSMKHYWHEAVLVPDVADTATARAVAARFLELRDDDVVGGLVLRRFERYSAPEVRTWWVDGRCVLSGPHPDAPGSAVALPVEPDVRDVGVRVAALGLPFVTVDLALRDDGSWRVVELGDGQVSDRGVAVPPVALLTALTADRAHTGAPAGPQRYLGAGAT